MIFETIQSGIRALLSLLNRFVPDYYELVLAGAVLVGSFLLSRQVFGLTKQKNLSGYENKLMLIFAVLIYILLKLATV